jgi:hypothetical protein
MSDVTEYELGCPRAEVAAHGSWPCNSTTVGAWGARLPVEQPLAVHRDIAMVDSCHFCSIGLAPGGGRFTQVKACSVGALVESPGG